MRYEWNGLKLTGVIDAETPPLASRRGVYRAKEAGKPPKTPMFWAWWDGEFWGPITRDKDNAYNVYREEVNYYGPVRRKCHYQGIIKS